MFYTWQVFSFQKTAKHYVFRIRQFSPPSRRLKATEGSACGKVPVVGDPTKLVGRYSFLPSRGDPTKLVEGYLLPEPISIHFRSIMYFLMRTGGHDEIVEQF